MAYASSATYAGLYSYKGRQIELFHKKWFNCG